MSKLVLTTEQEAEARRMAALVARKFEQEALEMCRLMVSKADRDLLGKAEFAAEHRRYEFGRSNQGTRPCTPQNCGLVGCCGKL